MIDRIIIEVKTYIINCVLSVLRETQIVFIEPSAIIRHVSNHALETKPNFKRAFCSIDLKVI